MAGEGRSKSDQAWGQWAEDELESQFRGRAAQEKRALLEKPGRPEPPVKQELHVRPERPVKQEPHVRRDWLLSAPAQQERVAQPG